MAKEFSLASSPQVKADLFQALYQMESAGLSASQALKIINSEHHSLKQQLIQLELDINKGHSISQSGFNVKLFNPLDRDIIHAGESSGRLATTYQQLYRHYQTKARHNNQIKTKLTLPIVMLVVMIFLQPIVGLVTGEMSVADYLMLTVGTLVKLALVVYLILNGGRYLKIFGLEALVNRVQLSLPLVSKWLIRKDINRFFSYLGLLLSSGLVISQALNIAIDTIDNKVLRKKFQRVKQAIENGQSLADSLRTINEINHTTIQHIDVGEQSGRLQQTIQHLSEIETNAIAEKTAFIADWIPRLIYSAIAVLIAYSIISTATISSI